MQTKLALVRPVAKCDFFLRYSKLAQFQKVINFCFTISAFKIIVCVADVTDLSFVGEIITDGKLKKNSSCN